MITDSIVPNLFKFPYPMCHSCCAAQSSNTALLQYCIPHSLAWCAAEVLAVLQLQHCCNAVWHMGYSAQIN
jgi:hypothetical protein